jgi:hypothetical protein
VHKKEAHFGLLGWSGVEGEANDDEVEKSATD